MPKRTQTPKRPAPGTTRRTRLAGQTDWDRVRNTTDEEIDRQIVEDPDSAPEINESWMETAELVVPSPKEAVSIRLDRDVLAFFKRSGPGYQTKINAVLRAFVEAKRATERKRRRRSR